MITYNHEKFIAQAIEGVLMQKTDFPFELIIGEDCSTDRTREIVVDYANRYPEIIKPILHEKNVGAKANSESVREACTGKYVALCEGDDYWIDPLKLQKQVDFMESHPECTLSIHNAVIIDSKGKNGGNFLLSKNIKSGIYSVEQIALFGFVPTASILYRKHIFENPPVWFSNARPGDYALILIVCSAGYAYYSSEVASAYRHGVLGSATVRLNNKPRIEKVQYFKQYIHLIDCFDEYTNCKYKEAMDQVRIRKEIAIIELEKDFASLRRSRYKSYVKSLSISQRLKMYLRMLFPKAYKNLAGIKSFLIMCLQSRSFSYLTHSDSK